MTHDDRAEFSVIIDDTWAAFDRDPRPGVKEKLWEMLIKFSIRTVRVAFDGWIESEQRVPTPAAIKKLAFDIRRAEKAASERTADADQQAESSPWVPLCWTTSIAIGVTNPDITHRNPSPPSAERYAKFLRQLAREFERDLGANDRRHLNESEIRERIGAMCRKYAAENGFTLRPIPTLARALLRRARSQ